MGLLQQKERVSASERASERERERYIELKKANHITNGLRVLTSLRICPFSKDRSMSHEVGVSTMLIYFLKLYVLELFPPEKYYS